MESLRFSLGVAAIILSLAYLASRKLELVPGRMQSAAEVLIGGFDDFVCGILGASGRKYTPFIGTLFIYIFFMNILGLVPFMKSPTADWSITAGLALCVFIYVQYTAIKNLGFIGYVDHLAERPRGIMAASVVIPVLMFFIHLITELVKPLTLSLRLRSNIWGDDMLLEVLAGFGMAGIPLMVFSYFLAIIASLVQAVVFCLLTTIYFALVLTHEE